MDSPKGLKIGEVELTDWTFNDENKEWTCSFVYPINGNKRQLELQIKETDSTIIESHKDAFGQNLVENIQFQEEDDTTMGAEAPGTSISGKIADGPEYTLFFWESLDS